MENSFTLGSTEELDNVKILQSCNDLLLCCGSGSHAFAYVYNPCTNLFKRLPQPENSHDDSPFLVCVIWRMAFDHRKSPFYKVVQFMKSQLLTLKFKFTLQRQAIRAYAGLSTALSIGLGEKEDDSFLVINLSGKVVKYNLISKTTSQIFDIRSNQMDDDADDYEFFPPYTIAHNPYEFTPSFNDAFHWLEGLNRQLKHYKLNIEDHDHPIMTTLEIPHGLHKGRNFLESFGGSSDDPILQLMEIPHMLHLEGKFFESYGCLLLVCRDDIGFTEFTIYEMMKGSSVRSVRYLVNTEELMNPLPEGWSIRTSVWSIGLKEEEEDSFLVINLSGKVVKYNLISKTINEIFDIGSNQMDDDDVEFILPFSVDPNLYEFIPSLAIGNTAAQKRRQNAVSVGKERREALFRTKRLCRVGVSSEMDVPDDSDMMIEEEQSILEAQTSSAVEELKLAISFQGKGAVQKKVNALRELRRLLSRSEFPPIETAIKSGAIPLLAQCLSFGSQDEQLLEAAWCLTNIAAGQPEETRALLPALPLLIAHIGEKSSVPVAEQCAWALGNVAGEGEELRRILISQGALLPLAKMMLPNKGSTVRTAAWALSNLIKGPEPKAATELIKVDGVVEAPKTLEQIVLRSLDNIIHALSKCLNSEHRVLKKEAAWVLSNIAAGSIAHKQLIYKSEAVPLLVQLLSTSTFDIKKEVAYVVGNLCVAPAEGSGRSSLIFDHLVAFVRSGCLRGFIDLVRSADIEAARLGLQFMELVLRGMPNGEGQKLVEKEDGIDAMERFQFHENEDLRNMANQLVDKYFGEDYGLDEQ
ncbi:importin subunit alpha-9 [Tanacetum coccineum]